MDLLEAYGRLGVNGLPEMRRGRLLQEARRECNTPEEAWRLFADAAPVVGWFQCQSHQQLFTEGVPDHPDGGILLAAEAVDKAGRSVSLRQDGAGRWILLIERHDDEGDQLWDEVRQLIHGKDGHLRYRRYWRKTADGCVVQWRACLVGIDERGEQVGARQ